MKNKLSERVPLVPLAVCLMAGIIVGEQVTVSLPLLPVLVGLMALTLLLWRYELLQSVAIAGCFVVLGLLLAVRQKEALRVTWPECEVVYEAVVISEPIEKPKTVAVDILLTANGRRLKAYFYKERRREGDRSQESGDRSGTLRIGDGLKIQSLIEPNRDWHRGTFDYKRYLETHGFSGQTFVSSWKWQKAQVSLSGLSRLERTRLFFFQLRSQLLSRLSPVASAHSPLRDAYSVVAAMALGDKAALTQELKDVYSITGASHILALSGLHLSIIYMLLTLIFGGRRKLFTMHSSLFTIISVWAFVFLVGMPVSVVRAATMLTVYALLSLGRRDRMSVNTLAFTVIVLLMVSPLSFFDIGFQMSFMAVLSILLWMPLLDNRHHWLWGMMAVSCAAQMGTAPLIAYYFGRFSCYFLLTNLIVIPAAMLILWLMPVVLLFPSLAYLLLYIVSWLNRLLGFLAILPGASISGLHPSVVQVVAVYIVIGAAYLLAVRLRATASR